MKFASLTLTPCWVIRVMIIVFAMWHVSSAQHKSKQSTAPQKAVIRQLHSEPVESDPPEGIKLLTGYKHKSATGFEGNQAGEILKSGGVKIKYEMGFSQGLAVDSDRKATYIWYREQKLKGRIIRYALGKDRVLVVSVPLDDESDTLHVANFYGTIRKQADVVDMLLMILPFAYR